MEINTVCTDTKPSSVAQIYRKWSIKHRGAYLILPFIGAALIRERRFFRVRVNTAGEDRENKERRVLDMHLELLVNQVSRVSLH